MLLPGPEVTPRCHDFEQLSEIVSEIVPRFGDGHECDEWISRDRYRITVMMENKDDYPYINDDYYGS